MWRGPTVDRPLIEPCWGALPKRAARLSGTPDFVLRDGEYAEAVPPVAAYAPPRTTTLLPPLVPAAVVAAS